MERHRTDGRDGRTARHVDHWRPIHGWDEKEVWSLIEEYKIRMHPAYLMGWSRLSCATCIFGSGSQWASVKRIDPKRFERIAAYEEQFGKTIHRTKSIREQVIGKEPYPAITDELARKAMSFTYEDSIFMDNWELPAGAFGESAGPT
jgi:3'-phosphoadenosine 5'-phosphosulfate sulfotransferase (PAPS reductase)/FAD synthetase